MKQKHLVHLCAFVSLWQHYLRINNILNKLKKQNSHYEKIILRPSIQPRMSLAAVPEYLRAPADNRQISSRR